MRGFAVSGSANDALLYANTSDAESVLDRIYPTSTGFGLSTTSVNFNASGATYIYIAIRRGPMKTPTTGTSVFSPIASSAATGTTLTTSFPVDAQIFSLRTGTTNKNNTYDRLRGVSSTTTESGVRLITSSTAAETAAGNETRLWDNTSFQMPSTFGGASTVFWNFRRAPGFFDVVCYTGTGSATTVTHNLGVAPELMIVKRRDTSGTNWCVYAQPLGAQYRARLNTNDSLQLSSSSTWNNTAPTASVFSLGNATEVNTSGGTYVAYLFASAAGISKIGSYTGNGSSQTINCGFTSGSRFVLVRAYSSANDWLLWDSARGIVASNDPHLALNDTAAEITTDDSVDTDSSGFIVNQNTATNINVNNASYLFFAVA